jgi:hypothetical protein
MFADTKAVRKVLKAFNVSAFATDKSRGNLSDETVRIVVADVRGKQLFEDIKQAFMDLGYTNKVYFTGDAEGVLYLRVKTFLA